MPRALTIWTLAFILAVVPTELCLSHLCEGQVVSDDWSSILEVLLSKRSASERLQILKVVQTSLKENNFGIMESNASSAGDALSMKLLSTLLLRESDRHRIEREIALRIQRDLNADDSRFQVSQETKSHLRPIRMVPVSGGRFCAPSRAQMLSFLTPGNPFQPLMTDYELPYDFEVMDVPVTRGMWFQHMGGIDSFLERAWNMDQGFANSPITSVTLGSALEFANRVSRSRGLNPAYEIGQNAVGSARDGTLHAKEYKLTDFEIEKIEGFRLPTELEWLRLVSSISQELNALAPELQLQKLNQIGWFAPNSGRELKDVGTRSPTFVDGLPVYDLIGLVTELVVDISSVPIPSDRSSIFHTRGLDHTDRVSNIVLTDSKVHDGFIRPDLASNRSRLEWPVSSGALVYLFPGAGLRLVRTLPREKKSRGPQPSEN